MFRSRTSTALLATPSLGRKLGLIVDKVDPGRDAVNRIAAMQ